MSAIPLRDYQQRGFNSIRRAYFEGKRAPLYVAPTGAGKTRLLSAIGHSASTRGKHVWIVVHREELLDQTSRGLEELGIAHGVVAANRTPDLSQLVQVAMVETFRRRLKMGQDLGDVDLIIFDEAHHAVAGAWKFIRERYPKARILGVTATPERLDGRALGDIFDELIIGPLISELMRDGWLSEARTYVPPALVDLAKVRVASGDFDRDELAAEMDRSIITGDAVAHYARLCRGEPAIAFCVSVAHAEHVAEQFRAAGFRSQSVDGTMKRSMRRARIRGLETGEVQVLTSCDLISEGTDIPAVSVAILLRPTQSLVLHLQTIGRALRPVYAEGFDLNTTAGRRAAIAAGPKPFATVLDHVGNCIKHGPVEEEREWRLTGKRKLPKKAKGDAGVALRQVTCPKCYRMHKPEPTCPQCGHVYETKAADTPEQVAGTLRQLTDDDAFAMRQQKENDREAVRRARTLVELQAIAKARGYSASWAPQVLLSRRRKGIHT